MEQDVEEVETRPKFEKVGDDKIEVAFGTEGGPTVFVTLKSGRHVFAHEGVFGVAENRGKFQVTQGCCDDVSFPRVDVQPRPFADIAPPNLTADDVREIADMMIDRWTRFRASLPS